MKTGSVEPATNKECPRPAGRGKVHDLHARVHGRKWLLVNGCGVMKKEAAIKVNEMLLECYFKLHDTIDIVREHSDAEEHAAYCQAVGQVLGYLLLDVLDPIHAQYPELRPEQIAPKKPNDAPEE